MHATQLQLVAMNHQLARIKPTPHCAMLVHTIAKPAPFSHLIFVCIVSISIIPLDIFEPVQFSFWDMSSINNDLHCDACNTTCEKGTPIYMQFHLHCATLAHSTTMSPPQHILRSSMTRQNFVTCSPLVHPSHILNHVQLSLWEMIFANTTTLLRDAGNNRYGIVKFHPHCAMAHPVANCCTRSRRQAWQSSTAFHSAEHLSRVFRTIELMLLLTFRSVAKYIWMNRRARQLVCEKKKKLIFAMNSKRGEFSARAGELWIVGVD